MSSKEDGVMIVLSSPSGAGKTTLTKLLSTNSNYLVSISHTTRKPRINEIDGKDYYFISENEFKSLVDDGLMIEFEKYGGFYYGTSKKEVLKESNIILLDLEVNGATKLLSQNNDYIGIFIDIDDKELVNRLKNRGHDEEFINKRMELASLQREKKSFYQYHVNNVDINTSVNQILDIIYELEES